MKRTYFGYPYFKAGKNKWLVDMGVLEIKKFNTKKSMMESIDYHLVKDVIYSAAENDVRVFNSKYKEIHHRDFINTFIRAIDWYKSQLV